MNTSAPPDPELDRLAAAAAEHHAYVLARVADEKAEATDGAEPALWRQVTRMYDRAITEDPGYADSYYRRGLVQERLRDWTRADQSYQRFLELEPDHEDGHYRRGYVLQQLKQKQESKRSYATALALNPQKPRFLADMLAMEGRDFVFRSTTATFVTDHLDEIRSRAAENRGRILPFLDRPVFMYWGQGLDAAPPVVRACAAQAREVIGPVRLHQLDADNWPYYTDLPARIVDRQHDDPTQFADNLRLSLLSRYGGVWIDATCYLRTGAAASIDDLLGHDLFAFRYVGPRISNWFLTAKPASYFVSMMEATMQLYWEHHDTKLGYFMFHDMFEVLYWADPRTRKVWDAVPALSSQPPHALQQVMFDDGDEHRLDELVQAGFVHKLTHKYPASRIRPDSLLSALIRRAPTPSH